MTDPGAVDAERDGEGKDSYGYCCLCAECTDIPDLIDPWHNCIEKSECRDVLQAVNEKQSVGSNGKILQHTLSIESQRVTEIHLHSQRRMSW